MTTERIIDLAAQAYIRIMGLEKWNGLTDQQKHDAVMAILNDFYKKL